ncbi:unnamed protein product [Leptosia nina]|uniref:Uncharacterized protein n=1 Tax=Leptosia nina TaxID=320188 RepID=A0AAV1IYB5_9NEOP
MKLLSLNCRRTKDVCYCTVSVRGSGQERFDGGIISCSARPRSCGKKNAVEKTRSPRARRSCLAPSALAEVIAKRVTAEGLRSVPVGVPLQWHIATRLYHLNMCWRANSLSTEGDTTLMSRNVPGPFECIAVISRAITGHPARSRVTNREPKGCSEAAERATLFAPTLCSGGSRDKSDDTNYAKVSKNFNDCL